MNRNVRIAVFVAIGVVFFTLAVVYVTTPAKSLPSFLPGYDATLVKHHYKHAIGSLLLGLGALAAAWFTSGKKSSKEEHKSS